MCLSVYLGTNIRLDIPSEIAPGSLGVEVASWTPPPLRRNHQFTYYFGRKGEGTKLECSCMLAEHVVWTASGPVVSVDELYPDAGPCPFETLQAYCAAATANGRFATIVCDDSGGVEQNCADDDYCTGALVRLEHIARGHLLFADASGGFPLRVMHVVNSR